MKTQIFLVVTSLLLLARCSPADSKKNIVPEYDLASSLWTEADRQIILTHLNRTTAELLAEIDSLSDEQWTFKEAPDRWSINEIIEHLEVQNELHFREISVVSVAPQQLKYLPVVKSKDDHFMAYATDTTAGQARWFLQPLGRFPTKEAGRAAFLRAREHLRDFVIETNVDLRKHFTFRKYVDDLALSEIKFGEVRDLHQLLLTGIAHTDRHLRQIRKIKEHEKWPE